MCGRCRHVFNAFESLKRIEDSVTTEIADYSVVDSGRSIGAEFVPDDATHLGDADLSSTLSELAVDHSEMHGESPAIAPLGKDADFLTAPTAGVATYSAEDWPLPATVIVEPAYMPAGKNPLIAGSALDTRSTNISRIWNWLVCLVVVLFGLQSLYFFRSEITQQYPQFRPYFVRACGLASCTVSWGRDQAAIKIESSDLIEPPGKPGRILLTAMITNRAKTRNDFPSIEVKLMDTSNVVLASRILSPSEYLGRVPSSEESIAPNAELYVNLNLELAGKVPASGYGLRAFYP